MGMDALQPDIESRRFDWFDALDDFNRKSDARPQVKRAFERLWRWAGGNAGYVYGFTITKLADWLPCEPKTAREIFEELLTAYTRKGTDYEGLGLVDVIINEAGVMKLYVYDPREELRQRKPEPDDRQRLLFDEDTSGIFAQKSPTPSPVATLKMVRPVECGGQDAAPSGICAQKSPPPDDSELGRSPATQRPTGGACAVADGHLLPALLDAIRAKLGADRFELWLGRNHFSLQGDTLVCACPTPMEKERAFKLRYEIVAGAQSIRPAIAFSAIVDRELATALQGSGILVPKSPTSQEVSSCSLEPLQGSKEQERKKDLRGQPPMRRLRDTALGKRAAEIHQLVDDLSCWRWCCILAAYAEQQGWLSPNRIDAMAAEPYFCRSLKQALIAQKRYLEFYPLKTALKRQGIKWENGWGQGAENFWDKGDRSNVKPRPR